MSIIKNLKIEKIVAKGYGIGYSDNSTVFVRDAVPGDILDVEIVNIKKKILFSRIKKIIKPSEMRIESKCEVYGNCGGCSWLDIDYDEQLNLKEQIIKDTFRKIENTNNLFEEISPSPEIYHYRNKNVFPIQKVNEKIKIGMYERKSHRIIENKNCLLQPKFVNKIIEITKNYLKASKEKIYNEKKHSGNVRFLGIRYSEQKDEIIVFLVTKNRKLAFTKQLIRVLREEFPNIVGIIQNINPTQQNKILGDDEKILFGRQYMNYKLGDTELKVNYKSFLQINYKQAEKIYSDVKINLPDDSVLIDAFSGIGSIGIFMKDKISKLYFIEENTAASKDADFNAEKNGIEIYESLNGKVENVMKNILKKDKIDAIIFDPARKGIEKSVLEEISNSKIPKIIYVSCNPATQVRDLEILLENNYKIEKIKPYDMFPHTPHIENLVVLNYEKN